LFIAIFILAQPFALIIGSRRARRQFLAERASHSEVLRSRSE
jgi:hypothetical protein